MSNLIDASERRKYSRKVGHNRAEDESRWTNVARTVLLGLGIVAGLAAGYVYSDKAIEVAESAILATRPELTDGHRLNFAEKHNRDSLLIEADLFGLGVAELAGASAGALAGLVIGRAVRKDK